MNGSRKKVEIKREFESAEINIPEYMPRGTVEAFQILDRELNKKKVGITPKILLYGDPDIDGLIAELIPEEYLKQLGYSTMYTLNGNRAHGFKLSDEQLEKLKGGLIIAVDFSISKEDFDRILQAGVSLINIDHHEIEIEKYTSKTDSFVFSKCGDAYGIILNNQYSFEPKEFKFLSGAGMVYYFMKYVSRKYEVPLYSDYAAMVGISLLSDIRELESQEASKFLYYLYNLDSPYLKFLVWLVSGESNSSQRFTPFGVPRICRNFIDFTFSPVFNSMLRANRGETAIDLLRGVEDVVYSMRSYDTILRFKEIQKKIIAAILKRIKEDENQVGNFTRRYKNLIVASIPNTFEPVEGYDITNYVGVTCSQLKDEDKTGAIFVIDESNNMSIRGSVRGGMDGIDYLSIFQRNGVPCAGHHNAFGILPCDISKIDFDKISADIEEAENKFKETNNITRKVVEINNLSFFAAGSDKKNSQCSVFCTLNEYCRDNHRIYLKYTGSSDDVKQEKVSEKYIKYKINGITVQCFDPTLPFEDSLISMYYENGKYVKYILRPKFEYDHVMTTDELTEFYIKLFGSDE